MGLLFLYPVINNNSVFFTLNYSLFRCKISGFLSDIQEQFRSVNPKKYDKFFSQYQKICHHCIAYMDSLLCSEKSCPFFFQKQSHFLYFFKTSPYIASISLPNYSSNSLLRRPLVIRSPRNINSAISSSLVRGSLFSSFFPEFCCFPDILSYQVYWQNVPSPKEKKLQGQTPDNPV